MGSHLGGQWAQTPLCGLSLSWVGYLASQSLLAREGAGCGSVGDVPGAWLASALFVYIVSVNPLLEH